MNVKTYQESFAGKPLFIEIGKLATQAHGSCRIQYGDTTILVTATMAENPKDGDFFPLTVAYEERYYAAGKIKGSKWLKREGRPSDEAILTRRLIDRPLRPRFNQSIRNEVQVVVTVLSFDGENDPDVLSIFGASLALMISNIPFNGPVSAIRIGRVAGKLVFNPNYEERAQSDYDVVIACTDDKINMIEAGAKIIKEAEVVEGIEKGFDFVQTLNAIQKKIAADISPTKKQLALPSHDEELASVIRDFVRQPLETALYTISKTDYKDNTKNLLETTIAHVKEKFAASPDLSAKLKKTPLLYDEEIDFVMSKNILEQEKRPDGRKLDELRALTAETNVLPHSHGTGLFQRGNTQVLGVLTLASPGMEQWVESMEINLTKKRFMHHYVFPPFSVGEVGRVGFPGGREIGHGALAERALEPVIPDRDAFPYTIRLVSEVLSSNGSSSMASACASSLALMDGGVPIKTPVAGIAMGIIVDDKTGAYKILTDIQGPEDHHGDMDLKIAGTRDGLTALQMDVKIEGITPQILRETFEQSKKARLQILDAITAHIPAPRAELSPYAPRVEIMKIDPEKIRLVIGSQGKTINEIIDRTGVQIDIEDDGTVFITSDKPEGMKEAIRIIGEITFEPKPGDEFTGPVSRLFDFGAMVMITPGLEGLVHISEMSDKRLKHPSEVVKVGDKILVRVKNIDEHGRINLTMKTSPARR